MYFVPSQGRDVADDLPPPPRPTFTTVSPSPTPPPKPTPKPTPKKAKPSASKTPKATPKPSPDVTHRPDVPVQRPSLPPVSAKPPVRTATPTPTPKPAPEPSSSPVQVNLEIRAQVIFLVNQQRANYGLRTLASNSTLATTAQQWSNRMSADRWMRHSSHAPENVAMGYNSAQSVMDAWMASDGHRRNILDPRAVYVGAGFLNGFWTLQFGY